VAEQEKNKGRVLIADDDEAFRVATRAFLTRQGFECEAAKDGTSAVEMLRNSNFDLLISDINMPGNCSLEMVEQLQEAASAIPVILLTGYPSVQSAARSVRLRVAAYLVKPCDADELLSIAELSIAQFRAYRTVMANRDRLDAWARDLEQIENAMRSSPAGNNPSVTEAYLNLTLSNILSLMLDLKNFTDSLTKQPGQEAAAERVTLHRAVRDTIDVLERTKQSFKSKELGELRRRLEDLIRTAQSGPPNAAEPPKAP
jgi:DNA-binding response OmpR family regulator